MTSDDHAGPREIPATMRVARATSDLIRTREFYEQLVGLAVLGEFADHDGYDSVIFGVPDERAQLEIVDPPHAIVPQPTVEDALVLYLTPESKTEIAQRLRAAGAIEVAADTPDLNPYWPRSGATAFVDPDGYMLILASD